ncbi:MAG TPA: DUF4115 domain-containing protein, partial [Candidatus Deferrimicrobium sp.]|nr:DUF4115 domain-containing protein [Candidatus Deferrimicrobium sp.]
TLRISADNLRHVESGCPVALPAELYFFLFAKAYAETLGIDYTNAVDTIKEDLDQPPPEPAEATEGKSAHRYAIEERLEAAPEPAGSEKRKGRRLWRTVALIAGFVAILVATFVLLTKRYWPREVGQKLLGQMAETAGGSKTKESDRSDSAQFANYNWNVPGYTRPADLELTLSATGACPAVVLADGDTVVNRTLTLGETQTVTARYRLEVSLAAPAAVDITLNGRTVDLRNSGTGRVDRIQIDQANVEMFLKQYSSDSGLEKAGSVPAVDSTFGAAETE